MKRELIEVLNILNEDKYNTDFEALLDQGSYTCNPDDCIGTLELTYGEWEFIIDTINKLIQVV